MKRDKLEENIRKRAEKYRTRANKDHLGKRHDPIKPDEGKAMRRAFHELGWSTGQIGKLFDRDRRAVLCHLDKFLQVDKTEKQPALVEDPVQRAHCTDLARFLHTNSEFSTSFSVMSPTDMLGWMTSQREGSVIIPTKEFAWESRPIISRIREHCSGHELWQHIEEFRQSRAEYYQSIFNIQQKLRSDFELGLGFPAKRIIIPGLERQLLSDVLAFVTAQLPGTPARQGIPEIAVWKPKGRQPVFRLGWGGLFYADGTQRSIERAKEVVEDMLKRWSDSEDIRAIVRQYYRLRVLSQGITSGIQQIDEVVLAHGRCPDCPVAVPASKVKD